MTHCTGKWSIVDMQGVQRDPYNVHPALIWISSRWRRVDMGKLGLRSQCRVLWEGTDPSDLGSPETNQRDPCIVRPPSHLGILQGVLNLDSYWVFGYLLFFIFHFYFFFVTLPVYRVPCTVYRRDSYLRFCLYLSQMMRFSLPHYPILVNLSYIDTNTRMEEVSADRDNVWVH